jgi:hypothetical protein
MKWLPSAPTIRRGSRLKLRLAENGIQWASSLSWLARDGVAVCGMFIVALQSGTVVLLPAKVPRA